MSAAQAFGDHFLPKRCVGNKTLRGCTNRKRDNIVLIEVDSDDFGDVIILDVPESFRQKFRKRPKNVISIDDDDDDDESIGAASDTNGDGTTSNRSSPTSVAHASNSSNIDEDSASEGGIPVKLSKSKRTYSGKSVSRNRYGLNSDLESSSYESDCSECEVMGDSSGGFGEQQEKASNSEPSQPVHNGAEEVFTGAGEVSAQHSGPLGQGSNSSNVSCNQVTDDLGDHAQTVADGGHCYGPDSATRETSGPSTKDFHKSSCPPHMDGKDNTTEPDCPVNDDCKRNTVENADGQCFSSPKHDNNDLFGFCSEELAEKCSFSQQNGNAEVINDAYKGVYFDNVMNVVPGQDTESNETAFSGGQPPSTSLDHDNSSYGNNASKSAVQHSDVLIDRQKIKETDEYKRAVEEELASRQQQLQRQAEEARRLRSRKKAESMRVMVNERRQMQRIEEIRETRRKDEENLNLKEKLRVEVRKELSKFERICGDMASLLRCLGIPVGGGYYPSSNEVQMAYKRACLKFHPDRVSTNDLQQQVEAEEKFKLVSNMKDKFLLK